MINRIRGLHHVTSIAGDAQANNDFFTKVLGLRRVKKTVNFDRPDVYHLYYGDEVGTPGTVMTYFPFPGRQRGAKGTGETGTTSFSVPKDALEFWLSRLGGAASGGIEENAFGERRLLFSGPDGDELALVETTGDGRPPWPSTGIPPEAAITGFHSVSLRLADAAASRELLEFMGYELDEKKGSTVRLRVAGGNPASVIDIETAATANPAVQGAGSVHHVAFAVDDRAAQLAVREALIDTGYQVTPVIDRDYFWAIYFRTPGGVLFEVATNEPGFDRDEDRSHLGEALRLPTQHEHLRAKLEADLQPILD